MVLLAIFTAVVMSDDGLRAIVLSYFKVGIGGKSEDIINVILHIHNKGWDYLVR